MAATDWGLIHLLEGRLAWWRGKASYRRRELLKWKATGDRSHYWHEVHIRKHETAAAKRDEAQWPPIRAAIGKWSSLLNDAEREIHKLETAIRELKPKAQMWAMGGLVPPGAPYRVQRKDQGADLEIILGHAIRAPGPGVCIEHGSDRPWPNGFGVGYPIVRIEAGRFHDLPVARGVVPEWYVGHCDVPLVAVGEHFETGQPLAIANHSMTAGWGWCEWGHMPYGGMGEGATWEPALMAPVWR